MLRLRLNSKGQSTAEYAILIGVVIAAVVGMQAWVSGNLRAKIRDVALGSSIVDSSIPSGLLKTNIFEPGSSSDLTTKRSGSVGLERSDFGGAITRTYTDETTNRSGNVSTTTGVKGDWYSQ